MASAPLIIDLTKEQAFTPLHSYDATEAEAENTRVFYGDGSPFLRCPGLLVLEKVRMAGIDMPQERLDQVMMDGSGKNFAYIKMPMTRVERAADGTPILLRNVCSNDGNWQDRMAVFVTGEWDPAVPATVPEEPKPGVQLPPGAAVTGARRGRPPLSREAG